MSKKKKHKRSRSPDRKDDKSAHKHRKRSSEKKEEGSRDHGGRPSSSDRKRKSDHGDRYLLSPRKCSPDRGRELKKPVYHLTTSDEKKDTRKGEEREVERTEHHRRNERDERRKSEREREKKHSASYTATEVSTKDHKSTHHSSETSRSRSHSTSSPQSSKASLTHTQERSLVASGVKAGHSTAPSTGKRVSTDLPEQRSKLVKRRAEGKDPEPPGKISRSNPIPPWLAEELRKKRKTLLEGRSTEGVKASTLSTKQDRGVQQEKALSGGSAVSSSAKLSGSSSQRDPCPPNSGTTSHASPKPKATISFRIPKKLWVPIPQADIWDQPDLGTAQSAASPSPPSTTSAGQATAPPKTLTTRESQATASPKPLSTTRESRAAAFPKPLSTTRESQATASPKTLSTPRESRAAASPKPLSTTTAGQSAPSPTPPSTSGRAAALPGPLSTPGADQAGELTSLVYRPQQHEDNNVTQRFHSGPPSFSTSKYVPEQAQVMPSILRSHPSAWSSQTVPPSSFTLPEENHDVGDNDNGMQLLEELQQARCEHRLEVNVVESYGELTAMDIDPPEEGTTPSPILSKELIQQDLLIVMDTNILLSHLDLVKKIRSHGLGALGFPTVLIPWVVLQELDAIKNGKLTSAVERRATPAVNYIYTCLKNQEPRLWGQSMQQASLALCGLKTENNDDRVLQCCLQYQKLCPNTALILCTNDKNLCSKAVLSGVRALSKADLLQEVGRLNPGVLHATPLATAAPHTACPSWKPAEKDGDRSREEAKPTAEETARRKAEEERRRAAARELSESVDLLGDTLKGALSVILEQEMKEAFGDLWKEIVYMKPPWTLNDVLQCMKKHWIAVFGNIVQRGLQNNINQLSAYLDSDQTVDGECVSLALAVAVELFSGFSSRGDYGGVLPQSLNTLQGLLHRLQPLSSRSPKADDDSVMLEEEVSQASLVTHQDVWRLFENIWTKVWEHSLAVFADLRFVPGSMETALCKEAPPPSQQALCCLQNLCMAVAQLLQVFQRLLSVDCSVNDAQSLLTFIQTTEIAALEPHFTAQDLYDCLSQQEYRQKLCVGGTQLSELQVNLERCAAAVGRTWS